MNSPFNTTAALDESEQRMIIVTPPAATAQASDESGPFMNCMPNGDPDHVMLWGDDED